jgi:hypothetical protein
VGIAIELIDRVAARLAIEEFRDRAVLDRVYRRTSRCDDIEASGLQIGMWLGLRHSYVPAPQSYSDNR